MDWFEIKNWLELSTGLDRDSLHIYAGVGVQLTIALLCRRSLASPIPWLFVAVVALVNEYYDYSFVPENVSGTTGYYDEGIRDVWNTLLLPSLFLIIARFWPLWLTGKSEKDIKANNSKN
ncbi:hypothetical protein [Sphingorhabdus sp. M41]|uniref:hypothetical protein n=1 Tax=Sphingorhabdus sp. M41 TaxID=1806885 RepID=UPI00078D8917|nr:hypothetical protein [Sphingorhabdus sp. M41]AMO72113.1 hypothetical protein AZE99_09875 [Sphingorhabdus sp. M41]